MKALENKLEIPEIRDLQEELNVEVTGYFDDNTLEALEKQISETGFTKSQYVEDQIKKLQPENKELFIIEEATKSILEHRYSEDNLSVSKLMSHSYDQKVNEDTDEYVEIIYEPESYDSEAYQSIFEKGGRIVKMQQGGRQVITTKPKFKDVTVGELKTFGQQMGDKGVGRALAKGKVFDDLSDEQTVRIYDDNTFEIVGGGPQIGVRKGEGALSVSNWLGKGNVRASKLIGQYGQGITDFQEQEAEKAPEDVTEEAPKTNEHSVMLEGQERIVEVDEKGNITTPGFEDYRVFNGKLYKNGVLVSIEEPEGAKDAEEGKATGEKTTGKGIGTGVTFAPPEGVDIEAFQTWVKDNIEGGSNILGNFGDSGVDKLWGRRTDDAWKKYKDEYQKSVTGDTEIAKDLDGDGVVSKNEAELQIGDEKSFIDKAIGLATTTGDEVAEAEKVKKTPETTTTSPEFKQIEEISRLNKSPNRYDKISSVKMLDDLMGQGNSDLLGEYFKKNPEAANTFMNMIDEEYSPGIGSYFKYPLSPDKAREDQAKKKFIHDRYTKILGDAAQKAGLYKEGGTIFSHFRKGGKVDKYQYGNMFKIKGFAPSESLPISGGFPNLTGFLEENPDLTGRLSTKGPGVDPKSFVGGFNKDTTILGKKPDFGTTEPVKPLVFGAKGTPAEPEKGGIFSFFKGGPKAKQVGNTGEQQPKLKPTRDQFHRDLISTIGFAAQEEAQQQAPIYQAGLIAPASVSSVPYSQIGEQFRRYMRANRTSDPMMAARQGLAGLANTQRTIADASRQQAGQVQSELGRVNQQMNQEAQRRTAFENQMIQARNAAERARVMKQNMLFDMTGKLAGDVFLGNPVDAAKNAQTAAAMEQAYQEKEMLKWQEKAPELFNQFNIAKNELDKLPNTATPQEKAAAIAKVEQAENALKSAAGYDPIKKQSEAIKRQESFMRGRNRYNYAKGGTVRDKIAVEKEKGSVRMALQQAKQQAVQNKARIQNYLKTAAANDKQDQKVIEKIWSIIENIK